VSKLNIDKDTAINLAYGDFDNTVFEVISNKITGKSRWSYHNELIVKTLADNRYFQATYSIGATEGQHEGPFEYGEPNFVEVFPKTVEQIIYCQDLNGASA
jgi:hypothetical protein